MPDTIVKKGALLGFYVQTSLHPGSGTALGTVDLPIQRERHTAWPVIAGSAIKGVLRDACREELMKGLWGNELAELDSLEDGSNKGAPDRKKVNRENKQLVAAFGPATDDADKHAGALSITDARVLAFPVRSLKGVFAWVTCAEVLDRLLRDAALAGLAIDEKAPRPGPDEAAVCEGSPHLLDGKQVVLEEFDFRVTEDAQSSGIAGWIADKLLPAGEAYQPMSARFRKSLVVLHSDDFTHFVRYATEVSARIKLDCDTKTVEKGALFYQEYLPPETLFYSVVLANAARSKGANGMDSGMVMDFLRDKLPTVLQIGGDETTGKGYCAPRLCR